MMSTTGALNETESDGAARGLENANANADIGPEPGLCDQCKALLGVFSLDIFGSEPFYSTSVRLEDTAIKGCCLCQLFLDGIPSSGRRRLRANQESGSAPFVRHYYKHEAYQSNYVQYIHLSHVDPTPQPYVLLSSDIEIMREDHSLAKAISKSYLGISTGSATAMNTVRQWIRSCQLNHRNCARQVDIIPTRLIDCGVNGETKCRLVLGSKLSSRPEYTTLSYCWGERLPVLLLQENIKSMMDEIPVGILPKTLQDAIITTQSLGKRYLWIDSLCIVQNDAIDWQRESSMMGSIYGGSFCNISATAGTDSSSGLFQNRNALPWSQLGVKLKLRGKESSYYLMRSGVWRGEVEEAPLNERGWVCQERFMAPRNLHFGRRQLFWECGELAANEWHQEGNQAFQTDKIEISQILTTPQGSSKQTNGLEAKWYKPVTDYMSRHLRRSKSQESNIENDQSNSYVVWDSLLRDYTSRKLTFEKDKLIAISGLARIWGSINQDEYLAGLWRKDLERQLLWFTRPEERKSPTHEYVAPTWSWAAVASEVERPYQYEDEKIENLIEIMNIGTELSSGDEFGAVKGGSITLKGCLAAVQVVSNVFHDVKGILPAEIAEKGLSEFTVFWDAEDNWLNKDASDGKFSGMCALFVHSKTTWLVEFYGLILVPAERPSVYRRVGYFNIHDQAMQNIDFACENFYSLANERGLTYDRTKNGMFRYTITLV